jgi:hypothetical protein
MTPPDVTAEGPSGWHDHAVTVKFDATDDSRPISIYYALDAGDPKQGSKVRIADDGVHKVSYWAADSCGNECEAKAFVVRIDTEGPRTSIPKTVSVTQGKSAKITYVVKDVTPKAKIKLQLSGPSSHTYQLGWKTTGDAHTFKTPAGLAAGTYTVTVLAVDAAGNSASKTGTNKLTVKPKSPPNGGSTIWVGITESGECYHTLTCYHWTKDPAGNSKVTVARAKELGLRPCSVCNPPS